MVENRQLLLKLNAQVVATQKGIRDVLRGCPGLIAAVSEAEKESLFGALAESISEAETKLSRIWCARGRSSAAAARSVTRLPPSRYNGGCGSLISSREWALAVAEHTAFVHQAARADEVAVPYSVASRLLREGALVDMELVGRCAADDTRPAPAAAGVGGRSTGGGGREPGVSRLPSSPTPPCAPTWCRMLRQELFDKVQLLAPEPLSESDTVALKEMDDSFAATLVAFRKLVAT